MRRFRHALALALGSFFFGSRGEGLDPEEGRLRLRPLCNEAGAHDSTADPIRIACAVETGSFADAAGRDEEHGQVQALQQLGGESGPAEGALRLLQLRELSADALTRSVPVLMGGDANVHAYALDLRLGTSLDPVLTDALRRGFVDAHEALPPGERVTWPPFLVLDFVLGRGVRFPAAGVCPAARCGHLSDHLPLWAQVTIGVVEKL